MPKKDKQPRKPSIGGQAVIEGVMMKSPEYMAIGVRKSDGSIEVHVEESLPPSKKHKILGWPLIRGVVNFVVSLSTGMKTIGKAAEMLGLEEEEPSRFDKWLKEKLGDKAEKALMAFAMVLAMVLAVGLFFILPSLAGSALRLAVSNMTVVNIAEGLLRIVIFLAYIIGIGYMKDIQRVFAYHGAEHKTVHCYEKDQELTVENARKFSVMHPRCGTAFLFLIMVISIFVFSIFGWNDSALTRVVSRLLLLPLVAGVSYEVLRLMAFANNAFVRVIRAPGLWLQRLTTREPDDSMLEVAIAAFKAAQTGNADGQGEAIAQESVERVLL